ncbi:RUN domain containing protein [Asbolus verrucosus]|uniref:RUN domain containing protein n=1 Tax=Asbolus verrucosus TaxID=1661398 RepID=A0A482VJV1_ASBVE|nr:RUN domain containing protein [Asbolus verrucosus]
MFAVLQLGCGAHSFKRNDLKNSIDLRAKLEMAIFRIKELINEEQKFIQITTAVRKYLATSIRDLMQHGARCFPRRNGSSNTHIHAWEIILEYYHLKNGEKFNSTPARKLSQSFNLDIAGASPTSNKHNMLCTIGNIISTHTPYKRSYDSHFKAFVCAALNSNKLVSWMSLIFQCSQIIKLHYYPWSYVVKTGFQDSLKSLDTLTSYKFDLPVDLAVRQFQNIKDVFT